MKVCFKCGAEKPLSEFYKHSKMADGHLNKCKCCCKSDVKKNREEKEEYYKDYEKSRSKLPHRVEARREYLKTEAGAKNSQKAKDAYIKRNPKIRAAHTAVSNAVRDGKLTRASYCDNCRENLFTEAHHCDYNKPLEVVWLCERCHKDWHLNNDPVY